MTSRRRRELMRTTHGRAELARREKRNEQRGRRVIAERKRLGLSEEEYEKLPPPPKPRS